MLKKKVVLNLWGESSGKGKFMQTSQNIFFDDLVSFLNVECSSQVI